jgi:uncharacterized protein YegL
MINNYINHIVFVIDRSGSMSSLSQEVVKVFDSQIQYLAQRSKELDQETRVSVYLFNGQVECLVYDKDVLRLPSLRNYYRANGSTALIDGTLKAIDDLKKTPELYGDHSFLVYVLTDGQNTDNGHKAPYLANEIARLKDNWTVAVLVPSQLCAREAKQFGFPSENVQIWATDNDGLREVGEVLKKTTGAYMQARTTGVRGTRSLFSLDSGALQTNVVKTALDELSPTDYMLLPVSKDSVIKDFVESWTRQPYRAGSAYYQLTKTEEIQNHKQICVQNKRNGKIYSGANARTILGLPNYSVKVGPAHNIDFDIFVQSTSLNRKLIGGTKLVVIK